MALNHETFFGSDTTKPCCRMVFGISGSGKSVFLKEMLKQASRSTSYHKMKRFIVFDVKHESSYAELLPKKVRPATTIEEFTTQIQKSRIVVVHPPLRSADEFLSNVIEFMFATAQRVDDFTATLVLEESSTFVTPHNIPTNVKRLATQGRSLGLSLIAVNQRALQNKWLDSQSQSITLWRLARPDSELLKRRWGLCPDSTETKLAEKKFSFAHFDLETLNIDYYEPIEMTSKRLTAKAEIEPSKPRKSFGGNLGPKW